MLRGFRAVTVVVIVTRDFLLLLSLLRTFEGVLINDQQTASLHLVTKCDTVRSASVSCWTSGRSARNGSCYTGRDVLSHGTGTGVEGLGSVCRRIQDLDTHWNHTKRLCGFLVCNTPINKTIFCCLSQTQEQNNQKYHATTHSTIPRCLSQRNSPNVKLLNFINCSYRQRPFTGYSKTMKYRGQKNNHCFGAENLETIFTEFPLLYVPVQSNSTEYSFAKNVFGNVLATPSNRQHKLELQFMTPQEQNRKSFF